MAHDKILHWEKINKSINEKTNKSISGSAHPYCVLCDQWQDRGDEGQSDGGTNRGTEGRARGQLLLYNAASVHHGRFMEAGVSQSAGSDRLIT